MRATLSVRGLEYFAPNMWENLIIPDEMVSGGFRRDDLITAIRCECAELEILYPEPDTFQTMLRAWSRNNARSWSQMWKALTTKYEPLHNYDRHEEWNDNAKSKSRVAGFDQTTPMSDSEEHTTDNGHSGHIFGNVGVTTNATMLREEIETRKVYNMAEIITQQFKERFCICIY